MRDERVEHPCPEPDAESVDWAMLDPRLIHPTKVLIVEAMLWIGRPLSAAELEEIFDGALGASTIDYHLRSLAILDALGTSAGRRRGSTTRAARTH
jgi:hypothetical protein